jgi:hypothetical protein
LGRRVDRLYLKVITVGRDNRGFGGSNASDFNLATQIAGATLQVDGKAVIQSGDLK